MDFYGGAMKNILKKFSLIFVIGILSQPCIENTCWGMEDEQETEEEYYMDLPKCSSLHEIYDEEYLNSHKEEVLTDRFDDREDKFIPVRIKTSNNHYLIYFPINAKQPTTEDAVEWSCANADSKLSPEGRLTSPITEWYMKMFGYKQEIKAGYVSGNLKAAIDPNTFILSFDYNNAPDDFEKNFWKTFRVIASDPVGRLLLYRILIEIRRRSKKSPEGLPEKKDYASDKGIANHLTERNNTRHLVVACDNGNFNPKECKISMMPGQCKIHVVTISETDGNFIIKTDAEGRSADIGLFHEMLHWFHHLMNTQRSYLEKCGFSKDKMPVFIKEVFYGENASFDVDDSTWKTNCLNDINQEEMRTILGSPNSEIKNENDLFSSINKDTACHFLNGDELSENVYRLSRYVARRCCQERENNTPLPSLRFGHSQAGIIKGEKFDKIENVPNRFMLAHNITINRYAQISGLSTEQNDWNLTINGSACKKK